jgi:hypothetical protein
MAVKVKLLGHPVRTGQARRGFPQCRVSLYPALGGTGHIPSNIIS